MSCKRHLPITVSSVEGRLAGVPVTVSVVDKNEVRGGGGVPLSGSDRTGSNWRRNMRRHLRQRKYLVSLVLLLMTGTTVYSLGHDLALGLLAL